MAKQEIGRLGEALARDPELRAKLEQAKDIDAMIAAAREAGYAFTLEELRDSLRARAAELSEDQLERVAGGSLNFSFGGVFSLPAVQNVYKILIGL